MAALTDQQLVFQLQQGRRDALGQLFDRYSRDLYDVLVRIEGDRDEAGRLLGEVFLRVPTAVAGLPAHDSVRGLLYALTREAALSSLRQKGFLDALPPLDEPTVAGLASDIWKAARAMPAFHRTVLVIEELHPLSPTEKARALGIHRTDLARVTEEAQRSFNRQFDIQARLQGRPTSAQIETDRIFGLPRRLPNPQGTLFGFLPAVVLPESLQTKVRSLVMSGITEPPERPTVVEPVTPPPAPSPAPEPAAPAVVVAAAEPEPEVLPEPAPDPPPVRTRTVVRTRWTFSRASPPMLFALALLVGLVVIFAVFGFLFFFLRDTTLPIIDKVDPPDGGTVASAPVIAVTASFHDDTGIDPTRVKLVVDGSDVTNQSVITLNAASYSGPLVLGPHSAAVVVFDRAGNRRDKSWAFLVVTAPTPLPTAAATPTVPGPLPTLTRVPGTSVAVPSVTPSLPTATIPSCTTGILGLAFDDANMNQARDPGEGPLPNVTVQLFTTAGGQISTTITDSFGRYSFANLGTSNRYRVSATGPSNTSPTTPTSYTVSLVGCNTYTVVDFGLQVR